MKSEPKIEEKKLETAANSEKIIKSAELKKNPVETEKPLFEPIIITVPKTETVKPVNEVETTKEELAKNLEKETQNPSKTRQRVASETNTETNTPAEKSSQCKINVSQENVSLLNNGGSLGMLVSFDGKNGFDGLKAVSSSRNDVEITLETELDDSSSQAFFVIKSISAKTGEYKVTFESGCGSKEILVTIR